MFVLQATRGPCACGIFVASRDRPMPPADQAFWVFGRPLIGPHSTATHSFAGARVFSTVNGSVSGRLMAVGAAQGRRAVGTT